MGLFSKLGFGGQKDKGIVEPPIKFITEQPLPELDPELYVQTRLQVGAALSSWAQKMIMTRSAQGVQVQYLIDGVTHACPALPPDVGATMMAMIKVVAGINIEKPAPQQTGSFEIRSFRKPHHCDVLSQLSNTAERLTLTFDGEKPGPERMEDAGMRPKMLKRLKEILQQPGLVLVSAPPGQGFTTLFNNTVRAVDRYLRNVVAVEDVQKPDGEVENAPITTYDSKVGESPITVLPKLLLTYPDVICVRNMVDAESANLLFEQPGKEDRMVVAGIAAKDCVEALLRVLALKASREKFTPVVNAVINQRLLRKMCEVCKQQFPATPQMLKQLGVPQGKIKMFYRQGPPPAPLEEIDPKVAEEEGPRACPGCNGIGFRGRTAIFEMLEIDDDFRKALLQTNKLDVLRQHAVKSGKYTTLMDDGIIAAARGITTIQEVARVLKG